MARLDIVSGRTLTRNDNVPETGSVTSALRGHARPAAQNLVGDVGIEPTLAGLKVRCRAISAYLPVAGLRIELNCAGL
jgi:hypothetical protein